MNLKFKFNFWILKKKYKNFLKIKEKYLSKSIEKDKFVKFFIRDEEDKILNKKVLDGFNKQIQKYKLNFYKKENEINKLLFRLGICDLDYISVLYKYKVSLGDIEMIKDIFKNRLKRS